MAIRLLWYRLGSTLGLGMVALQLSGHVTTRGWVMSLHFPAGFPRAGFTRVTPAAGRRRMVCAVVSVVIALAGCSPPVGGSTALGVAPREAGSVGLVAVSGPLLVAGHEHSCAVTTSGGLQCWGNNEKGQLGDGTTTNSGMPVDVTGLASGVVGVAAGWEHTCALTAGGGVKCWGYNIDGRLGDGTTDPSLVPVEVVGLGSGVVAITAGRFHTCALTMGGGVKCWGFNVDGEAGSDPNDVPLALVPVGVAGLAGGVSAIAAADGHTCALTTGGGVKCWGYNGEGQLGDGTTGNAFVPVEVTGLSSGVTAIGGGGFHFCAVTSAGGVSCWGSGDKGELGNGAAKTAKAPVEVTGLDAKVTAITAGMGHTCALTEAGGVQCWGWNIVGQLGRKTKGEVHSTPGAVSGLTSGVLAVSAGGAHTCALFAAGVKCWGLNEFGQLGTGEAKGYSVTPVDVVGLGTTQTTNLRLGQTAHLPSLTITVSKRKTVKVDGIGKLQLFMVKSCVNADADEAKLGAVDWSASGPNGENYEVYGLSGLPELSPTYPLQRNVKPGKCLQGWVNFKTNDKLVELIFSSVMRVDSGQEASWKIG